MAYQKDRSLKEGWLIQWHIKLNTKIEEIWHNAVTQSVDIFLLS